MAWLLSDNFTLGNYLERYFIAGMCVTLELDF